MSGRRRVVANRTANEKNVTVVNNSKSCNHGCDCDNKYRLNKGIDISALFKRCLPVVIFLYGITMLRSRTTTSIRLPSSLPQAVLAPTVGNCEFRSYPKRRYYGLSDRPLPDFLDTEYIYGELPLLLHPKKIQKNPSPNKKLCVDQSEWYDPKKVRDPVTSLPALPFADGTNPSILKIDSPRIDPSIRQLLESVTGTAKGKPYYIATICMTDSQCSWNDSPEEAIEFRLSKDKKPSTVRTVLLLLNESFETVAEATIHTKIDAKFGRVNPNNQMKTFKLDDARLFTHKGQIWVSYREGRHFGYDKQVLNKLYFQFANVPSSGAQLRTSSSNDHTNKEFTVTLLASDTETLCCGRNMALIDNVHTNQLQALTWVDPVTVVDVEMSKSDGTAKLEQQQQKQQQPKQRRLKEEKKKSHFHGTNGFMVYLPDLGEYLGIGHFHRPPGRDKNDYARFGHHYTHSFFTITDKPPFRLKRLSPELVLESHAYSEDTEIIQFWSGLEIISDDQNGAKLALAYGINDCEAAALHMDLSVVEGLLREVPEGKEVVDFMMPLK